MIPGLRQTVLLGGAAARPWGAVFDGSNDYALRGAAMTGVADGKKGTLSVWVRLTAINSGARIFTSLSSRLICQHVANKFRVSLQKADGTALLLTQTSTSFSAVTGLPVHLLWSWDLGAGLSYLYANDASDVSTTTGPIDDTIDYSGPTEWAIGAGTTGTNKFSGGIAELWFDPSYLDISLAGNRRRFITKQQRPVDLGHGGEKPLGRAPLIYCSLRGGQLSGNPFAANRGSGGGFTVTGALDYGVRL